jgi:hypothetical protein
MMALDQLTKRERHIYRIIHAVSTCVAIALLAWYIAMRRDIGPVKTCIGIAFGGVSMVFGMALKGGIRIIHGVPWLRQDSARDDVKEPS